MCILFSYCGDDDVDSDYRLIVAENRDEYYDRPASNISLWEDSNVIAGKDLGAPDGDGTWFAVSVLKKKLGVLLNLPGKTHADAKSRGRIVTDYVQCDYSTEEYLKLKESFLKEVNEFILVTFEFGDKIKVQTYTNTTDKLVTWNESCLSFSNSLPEKPLSKATAVKDIMKEICSRLNKVVLKDKLIEELLDLLKSQEQHLPDTQLKNRSPLYKQLSSIFVRIPEGRYGTRWLIQIYVNPLNRTHTIVLLTKSGVLEVIEVSLQAPVDLDNPKWKRTEYQTNI